MIIGPNCMSFTDLTYLAININTAINSGRYDTLPIDEVRSAVQNGTIFAYLKAKLGSDIDLSIFDLDMKAQAKLLAEWKDIEAVLDARGKFGIEHRGLPLLSAFLLECIQRRTQEI